MVGGEGVDKYWRIFKMMTRQAPYARTSTSPPVNFRRIRNIENLSLQQKNHRKKLEKSSFSSSISNLEAPLLEDLGTLILLPNQNQLVRSIRKSPSLKESQAFN